MVTEPVFEIVNVEEAIKTNNSDTIKSASDKLSKVWSEAAQNLYQQPGAQGQPGQGFDPNAQQQSQTNSDATKDDSKNVEDASYEVVDDDK